MFISRWILEKAINAGKNADFYCKYYKKSENKWKDNLAINQKPYFVQKCKTDDLRNFKKWCEFW